jgi:hypothetical protein
MTSRELKSKVMTLGNKLAPRMGDRKAAAAAQGAVIEAKAVNRRQEVRNES